MPNVKTPESSHLLSKIDLPNYIKGVFLTSAVRKRCQYQALKFRPALGTTQGRVLSSDHSVQPRIHSAGTSELSH